MAVDDGDQVFEKALAQHLRGSNAETSASPSACPDAEILAAYHETSLTAEQAGIAKQHIQTCQRCQGILAQLKATDDTPLGVPAAGAQAPRSEAAAAIHVLKPRRAQIWRWVAPAGAIAAAILVWVGVRENPAVHKPAANEIVKSVASVPPAPPQLQSVPEAIAKAKPPQAAPLVAQLSPASPRSDAAQSRLNDGRTAATYSADSSTLSPRLVPAPRPSGVAGTRSETGTDALKAEEAELSRHIAAAEQKQELDAASNTLREVIPAPQSREQRGVTGGALDRRAAAESSAAAPKTLQKKAAAPAIPPLAAQEQQMEGMSRYKENATTLLAKSTSTNVTTVSAPGGSSMWRIGLPNAILHSADGGKTWRVQVSGTDAELLAGSATSDQICWAVGRAGTVLRTTDGGAHWQKLSPPTRDDLLSVSAVDATQAKVSATVGAYQTTDGGATWHRLASE